MRTVGSDLGKFKTSFNSRTNPRLVQQFCSILKLAPTKTKIKTDNLCEKAEVKKKERNRVQVRFELHENDEKNPNPEGRI